MLIVGFLALSTALILLLVGSHTHTVRVSRVNWLRNEIAQAKADLQQAQAARKLFRINKLVNEREAKRLAGYAAYQARRVADRNPNLTALIRSTLAAGHGAWIPCD